MGLMNNLIEADIGRSLTRSSQERNVSENMRYRIILNLGLNSKVTANSISVVWVEEALLISNDCNALVVSACNYSQLITNRRKVTSYGHHTVIMAFLKGQHINLSRSIHAADPS